MRSARLSARTRGSRFRTGSKRSPTRTSCGGKTTQPARAPSSVGGSARHLTRLARAPTARERSTVSAIEAFYAHADVATRSRAFADSMTRLAGRDTDDLEAAAFASLALQMAVYEGGIPDDQAGAAEDQAIALGERVFKADSTHPGVPTT